MLMERHPAHSACREKSSALEAALPLQAPQDDKLEVTISFTAFATLSILFQSARLDEANVKPQHATKPLKDYLWAKYPNANLAALKVASPQIARQHI